MTKVSIDREECTGCSQCWEDCPEVFEEGPDDNLSRIVKKYRTDDDGAEGDIPDDLVECARDAADSCPVEVITVD
ncbi:ferredoxin [Methanomicrobiaceae archaeon CYW5]|nr:ferredoxin [Methanovulcanius yangii]